MSSIVPSPSVGMEQVIITVRVGRQHDEQTFHIHRDILRLQSTVFADVLAGDRWRESLLANTISLREVEPRAFEAFVVDWLYTGRLGRQTDALLVEGYIFAYDYGVRELCNSIVRQLYAQYVWLDGEEEEEEQDGDGNDDDAVGAVDLRLPSYQLVTRAFVALPAVCMLNTLFVQLYATGWSPEDDDEAAEVEREKLPKAFFKDLAVRLARRRNATVGNVADLAEFIDRADLNH